MDSPELVRVDLTVPAHTADPVAGAVPFVHFEKFHHLFRPPGILLEQSQVDVGSIGVVVDGEDLLLETPIEEIAGAVQDGVNDLPGLPVTQILINEPGAAAAVYQMVETGPRDIFLFDEIEDRRDLPVIPPADGETDPDLDPGVRAVRMPWRVALKAPLTPGTCREYSAARRDSHRYRKARSFCRQPLPSS